MTSGKDLNRYQSDYDIVVQEYMDGKKTYYVQQKAGYFTMVNFATPQGAIDYANTEWDKLLRRTYKYKGDA